MSTIREIMTSHVITLSPEDDLFKADAIMKRGRLRHIPVVDGDGALVGLITQRDLLRAQITALGMDTGETCTTLAALPAKDHMTTNLLLASPDDDPVEIARHMLEHKVGCIPVVEDGKLIGIVSEADFVRWALDLVHRAAA